MSKTYFIADIHFGDENIMRYENRPFLNVLEMDKKLVINWNNVVKEDDIIYILGDFGADKAEDKFLEILNGTKYLIKGNHDIYSNEYYRNAGFKEVYDWICAYIF